jgi:hypothetical protein
MKIDNGFLRELDVFLLSIEDLKGNDEAQHERFMSDKTRQRVF